MVTLDKIYDKLRNFEEKNKEQMFQIEKRLTKLESDKGSVDSDTRLNDLEDIIRMNELQLIKLNERIGAGADVTGIIPPDIQAKLENMEKRLSTAPSIEGPGSSESSAKIDAFEERLNDVETLNKDKIEEISSKINEALTRVRDVKPADIGIVSRKAEELKDLENRLDRELDKRKDVINKLIATSVDVDKIGASISEARAIEEKLRSDIELASGTKDETYRKIDNALKKIVMLEEDTENRMQNAESKINSGLDKITHTQETLDTQMSRLDRKFGLIDKGGLSEDVLKNMTKKASEYQYKISQLAEQMKGMDFGNIEKRLEDLTDRIGNAEQRSDERSIKFLTQELERFAKEVDNKIPQLPSNSQFENIMRRIDQINTEVMHVQKPNIAPLEQRVELLANKVDDVMNVVRTTNTNIRKKIGKAFPVIVD